MGEADWGLSEAESLPVQYRLESLLQPPPPSSNRVSMPKEYYRLTAELRLEQNSMLCTEELYKLALDDDNNPRYYINMPEAPKAALPGSTNRIMLTTVTPTIFQEEFPQRQLFNNMMGLLATHGYMTPELHVLLWTVEIERHDTEVLRFLQEISNQEKREKSGYLTHLNLVLG